MSQIDIPGWLEQMGTLVLTGGGSVVVLKIIEKVFQRDDRQAVDRTTISSELRQDIRDLKADVKRLQAELEEARERNNALTSEIAQLKVREVWVRNRYHRLSNWLQEVPGMPSPPAWIFEEIPTDEAPGPSHRSPEKTP